MPDLDIAANRVAQKWTMRIQLCRLGWAFVYVFFRLSPRPFWSFRAFLLRLFGAKIGSNVRIHESAKITMPWNISIDDYSAIGDNAVLYALGSIQIGKRTTVSQNAHICAGTHDISDSEMALQKQPIVIGDEAWICADAFVSANVEVGNRAVVGARAVVTKSIGEGWIVVGNPSKKIGDRTISEK